MAKATTGAWGREEIESTPKKTRQGNGKHTKYASTSRNSARKPSRGQGKWSQRLERDAFLLFC